MKAETPRVIDDDYMGGVERARIFVCARCGHTGVFIEEVNGRPVGCFHFSEEASAGKERSMYTVRCPVVALGSQCECVSPRER